MDSRRLKFKQVRQRLRLCGAGALVVAGLGGCASMGGHEPAPGPAPRQPLAHLEVAIPAPGQDVLTQLLEAQFALDHDDLAGAARAYGRAAGLSSDPEVAERAARLALATHDPDGARHAIARWRKLGADKSSLAGLRARLALLSGDTAGARRQLQIMIDRGDQDAWRRVGRVLVEARDRAQAGQLLQSIATPGKLPADPHAWLAMSELGARLGRHDYARQLAAAAIKRFHCAQCYAWAAQLQQRIGHRDRARKLYARAVKKAPDDTRVRLAYAAMLGKQGDNAAAARVLAEGKQTAATWRARAAYAARAGDLAGLKQVYRQLTHAPSDVQAQSPYLIGQLAATIGHRDKALHWFARVPQDSKYRFDADQHIAIVYQQQGNTDKAHAMARQMQMDYADDPDKLRKAQTLDANLYMAERRFDRAIAGFSRALDHAPDNVDLLYGRGLAYAEAGKTDAAIADLDKVLERKPHDIEAANALGYTLADAGRDLARAEKLIARAHKARPDDPAITDSWGWVQYRLGHLDTAEKALQQAWKAGPGDPDIGGHLAQVLWKQGRRGEARKVLAAARQLAPDDIRLQALARKMQP